MSIDIACTFINFQYLIVVSVEGEPMQDDVNYVWDHYMESVKVKFNKRIDR